MNNGQMCVSPDYVMIPSSKREEFIKAFKKVILETFGFDIKNNSDYSRIIDAKHFKKLVGLFNKDDAIIGGGYDCSSLYLEPTLIEVDRYHKLMSEEIFGPILPFFNIQ